MSVRIDDPARLGESELPDGRLLGWAEWGPSDGFPVLLCPGAATSRWLGLGADAVAALRVRLVSVDRPGLGVSTPAPGRMFGDFADDIRHLAARRGLGRPAVIGNSQGAPFALACAVEGIAGALALVSGADEVAAPGFADVLPVQLRDVVDKIAFDPIGAEEMFTGFTADAMWSMVTSGSTEADLAVYQDAVFKAAYRQALDEPIRSGPGRLRPRHRPGHGTVAVQPCDDQRAGRHLVRRARQRPLARQRSNARDSHPRCPPPCRAGYRWGSVVDPR
jgi:pimeloyl-ACP methyl ester carboxylesterase